MDVIQTAKRCKTCKEDKSLELFGKLSRAKDGFNYECKPCLSKTLSYYRQKNLERTRERNRINSSEYRLNLPIETKFQQSRYSMLKKRYGITKETYDEMLNIQNGVCAGCGTEGNTVLGKLEQKFLCVDHDHSTGKIRGLLCHSCNKALGLLQDNIETLKSLIRYLENKKNKH